MKSRSNRHHFRKGLLPLGASLVLLVGVMLAQPVAAQTFSIDFQGPTIGLADSLGGAPIAPADILSAPTGAGATVPGTPAPGPLPPPASHTGGAFGVLEADAFSYGVDPNILAAGEGSIFTAYFSVDEFAIGLPGTGVAAEAAALEAAADVFSSALAGGNIPFLDGNGVLPSGMPGLGLIEPNPPVPGVLDQGDNLDALDVDTTPAALLAALTGGPLYFSLDSAFPDPLEPGANTGTAAASGFVGGDVLSITLAGTVVYAPAVVLGLDVFGPDQDDLDALILHDDGDGVYTPGADSILFSVRRGSAIIGTVDLITGLPIEEGDILTDPAVFGLPVGSPPVIIVPADTGLGLATVRSGMVGPTGFADDLNALDTTVVPEPSCALLMLSALALIGAGRRRKV